MTNKGYGMTNKGYGMTNKGYGMTKQGLRDNKGRGLASPGMGMRHYAPRARLVLVEGQEEMLREVANYSAAEVGVMLPDELGRGRGGGGVSLGSVE